MDEGGLRQCCHGHADQLVGNKVLLAAVRHEGLRLRQEELLSSLQPHITGVTPIPTASARWTMCANARFRASTRAQMLSKVAGWFQNDALVSSTLQKSSRQAMAASNIGLTPLTCTDCAGR